MGCSFQGVTVVEEFITEEVEGCWVREMDRDDRLWILSQSGRRKQEFGPKVNFKKEEVKIDPSGTIFPSWSQEFLQLCSSSSSLLSDFEAVELGLLEYEPLRGSCIAPHIDDSWVWGERIVICSLLSDCHMSFIRGEHEVRVRLPRRSMLVMQGPARRWWMHSIRREDVKGRRISLTLRELSEEFQGGGGREEEGRKLKEIRFV
mmetsp:Transcript_1826/g.5537  ORF Transcript_1826/g.5537 Transcript_1826/m.5537 type:complete len:204 (-) Transcript_1826:50-661(-)